MAKIHLPWRLGGEKEGQSHGLKPTLGDQNLLFIYLFL